ncbi:hypothetical protein, partial [Desulfoscipio gibsoniae]
LFFFKGGFHLRVGIRPKPPVFGNVLLRPILIDRNALQFVGVGYPVDDLGVLWLRRYSDLGRPVGRNID